MTKEQLSELGVYADTATFIHGSTFNVLHDGDRASLYQLLDGGKSFKLLVEIIGPKQMRQLAAVFDHAADLCEPTT